MEKGTDKQTNTQTDSVTTRPTRPEGQVGENTDKYDQEYKKMETILITLLFSLNRSLRQFIP